MSLSHRYRNFGDAKPREKEIRTENSDDREAEKLEAFDAGYQAGWDDATKAHAEDKKKVSAEFSQNLLDLSFTYHEALAKLTTSISPAIQQIVEKLLPEVVRSALGARVLEQVDAIMKDQLSGPVEIVVNPKNVATLNEITSSQYPEPFAVTAEASLGEGQAFIRIGQAEKQVDLDGVVEDVTKAMAAFFHETTKDLGNGTL